MSKQVALQITKHSYQNLKIWQSGKDLVKLSYVLTSSFPKEEIYGLTSQIRRAAISIPSNIAEGAARNSEREFSHFLSIAGGSLSELETQFIIACELSFLNADQTESILNEIRKMQGMLWSFRLKLKNKINGTKVNRV